jgi:hypothetical protein
MTTERKKALLFMSATFVIGIMIGILLTGMFARRYYHNRDEMRGGKVEMNRGHRGNFVSKIIHVVKADSAQAKQIKPIVEETMSEIDRLQEQGDRNARAAMDSMKVKLTPVLRPEQLEDLEKFISRKKPSGGERGKHERRGRD